MADHALHDTVPRPVVHVPDYLLTDFEAHGEGKYRDRPSATPKLGDTVGRLLPVTWTSIVRRRVSPPWQAPAMGLNNSYRKCVVFIAQLRPQDDQKPAILDSIGTGFFVGINFTDEETGGTGRMTYIVTAAHVVRNVEGLYVQMVANDGEEPRIAPAPSECWYLHDDQDIALIPAALLSDEVDHVYVQLDAFADEAEIQPELGDPVYFIGLLQQAPQMARGIRPMVRAGNIGAVEEERVPAMLPGNVRTWITAS